MSLLTVEREWTDEVLCATDAKRLVLSLLESRRRAGKPGATEAEVSRLIEWARETKVAMHLLDLALLGQAFPDIRDDGEIVFATPERYGVVGNNGHSTDN